MSGCSLSGLDVNLNTASPQKTYLVKLEGRGQSLASTVQQVKLTVLKGTEAILVEDKFYREETDHPFSKEFPVHEWVSDSVLRFGKETPAQTSGDKIVVVNDGPDRVDVLKVEYASYGEKFLIFDFAAGAKLELPVLRSSGNVEFPNPNVSYTVYAKGQTSQNMATEWRKTAAGSEILIGLSPQTPRVVQDECSPTTLSTNSYVITGHIALTDGTKNLSGIEIEVFSLKADVWTSIGTIQTLSRGAFAWLAEEKGQYKFVASKEGFKVNAVIVNVKNLKEANQQILLPLSKSDCPKARYVR